MDRTCANTHCHEPEEVGCNRGDVLEDCPFWKQAHHVGDSTSTASDALAEQTPSSASLTDRLLRLPWTGNSLGLRDLSLVTASSCPDIVGLVGPYNAGKTTLLSLLYLVLENGDGPASSPFAGSLTLRGWENLAANLRWKSGTTGPRFPPHTSRAAGRQPGLLHLAFRDTPLSRRDLLLTDPPGEWFSLWAQKESAAGAEGARWVHEHASTFIFLVDRDALASKDRGKTREGLNDLARRLAEGLGRRRVAIVWTKSDVSIPAQIEADLRESLDKIFPEAVQFQIQMRFGDEDRSRVEVPCAGLLDWLLLPPNDFGIRQPFSLPVTAGTDRFLSLR
jgi:hypothetical protein